MGSCGDAVASVFAAGVAYTAFATVFLGFALGLLLLALATPFIYLAAACRRGWGAAASRVHLTPENLAYLEESALTQCLSNSAFQHDQTPVVAADGKKQATMHALIASRNAGRTGQVARRPALLLIHGTGGSALSFGGAINLLTSTYDVYALDLPGFSPRSPCHVAPTLRVRTSNAVDFYCQCIKAFIEKHEIREVTIVAHSFGGFLGVEFVNRYPELAGKLILVNPAGLFPTLGEKGAYWAVFFKLSLPQSVLRGLGLFGSFALACSLRASKAAEATIESHLAYYQLLAAPGGFGDRIVGDFIRMGGLASIWTQPVLPHLLTSKVPFAFIYGDMDGIMPWHQGDTVSKLSDAPIPVCLVEGAGHSPVSESPALFCTALKGAVAGACLPGPAARELAQKVPLASLMAQYDSPYSTRVTSARIKQLYAMLLEFSSSGSAQGVKWAANNAYTTSTPSSTRE
ncbi:Alpha/Beta hydrolase protein [Dunaliella salina]|uniref:Alpha/Beta hydrolase protein n=1 Tax=Dunaliella salina TaxID=3046 RepID=A0ABQ7H2I3_DUNSA|nr:Alpha/Beta hydrolase protein [Dunaliella salina]|eukprot:KAF5841062.1 Alpha/Beta hydrolase protein [Dunaliella salina]